MSMERDYIEHINYQYHLERKEKIKDVLTHEQEIKRLEELERL